MQRTILTIDGEAFHLRARDDIEELSTAILHAAQNTPEFLDISIAGDGAKRILITPTSRVKMETIEIPDDDGDAYDAYHNEFDDSYFDYQPG